MQSSAGACSQRNFFPRFVDSAPFSLQPVHVLLLHEQRSPLLQRHQCRLDDDDQLELDGLDNRQLEHDRLDNRLLEHDIFVLEQVFVVSLIFVVATQELISLLLPKT